MRILLAPLLIGTLVLAGASPAVAQSKPTSDQAGVSVGMAPTHDAAAERESYTQKARADVQIWQQKLHDFDAKAEVRTTDAHASAAKDLDEAWTETKTASVRLETAGEKDWDNAKASFKTASDKLAVSWHKVNPADK
jgi:hypothetical protein